MAILTDRTTLVNVDDLDIVHVVDVSDTTGNPAGTSKQALIKDVAKIFSANFEQIINVKTDLPAPVGGVISLEADTNYVLGDNVDLGTDRLDVSAGSISWTSNNIFGPTLTYTGTGSLFTGADQTFHIFQASLDCPNGGQLFDFSDTVPGTSILLIESVQAANCGKWGTADSLFSYVCDNSNCLNADDGLTLSGTGWGIQSNTKFALVSTSATFTGIDLGTSVTGNGEISNLFFSAPAGAVGVSGAGSSANVAVGSLYTFRDSNFLGGMTEISGISTDDIRWKFSLNGGIPDTMPDAMLSLNNNVTETVIGIAGTPVKVDGTWVVERVSQYTGDATGRATYNGERPLTTPVDITMIVSSASGTNKDVEAFLAVNGSVIANSGKTNRVGQNDPKTITIPWQLVMNESDFLEVFIQNDTDTTSIIVSSAVLRAR